jgi:hypothetical protein
LSSAAPSTGSSLVWPIGLACLVGLAIGFGVGYTVGIRDRASIAPTAAERPSAQLPAQLPAPGGRDFTDSTVATAPPAALPKAENNVRVPPPVPAPVVPFSGRVVVRSTPPGARVFVDGRDRGAAPATVTGLGQGEHRIRLVQEGYATTERRVVLSTERPSQVLTVPLSKAVVAPKQGVIPPAKADASQKPTPTWDTGMLVLDSRPSGANAFVDGRAVGKTPVSVPGVKAGDHTVRFELVGHFPWSTSINVEGGTSNRVGGSLEKID